MWKNVTPLAYSAKSGSLVITVTCGHVLYRPLWVMHCYELGMDTVPLDLEQSASPQEAQAKAIELVKQKIRQRMSEVEAFTV